MYRGTKEQTKYKQALARVRNLQVVYRGYAQRTKYQLLCFLALRLQAEYRILSWPWPTCAFAATIWSYS